MPLSIEEIEILEHWAGGWAGKGPLPRVFNFEQITIIIPYSSVYCEDNQEELCQSPFYWETTISRSGKPAFTQYDISRVIIPFKRGTDLNFSVDKSSTRDHLILKYQK